MIRLNRFLTWLFAMSVYGLKILNDSYYPDLRRIVDEIVKIVPKEKIQLIHTDEWTSSELSRLREKHELTGAYPKDIERLCCKNLVAQIAEDAKIPHAKTVFLDFRQPINRKEFLNRIILEITKFPMFVKPNRMCGSAGIAKIANMEVLEKWLTERFQEEIPGEYVIQEFIEGEEFGVTVVLLPDGTWKPLIVDFLAGTTYQEAILKGEPLFMAALEFGKAVNGSFPNLREFTQKVIDAFRPQHPQIFCIQAFQLFPGTDQYVLNELAYRVNGDRTNAVLYPTCGISQFTAVTLAHINPNYYPTENPAWKPQIQTLVSFMQQEGTLQSQNDCVLRTNLKSKIELKWFTNAGDSMPVPFRISDTLVKFMLYSTTEDERDADLEWIRKNWRPDVG
ncbi:hypothetical protein L596_022752 [Steinernema carpocapsae]|uniref:ATP-grasp domain-containing protein n=1 Tax=Steinernema carpocapsae TaxID=34508 RepID=A0A4U5MN40_STECR|nr:hypothetical protein L596_022752 [Steinernema carpocapsae]